MASAIYYRPGANLGLTRQATQGRPGSTTGSPYKKDVEATARLVACLQPTGSKKRGHNAEAGCIAGSVVGGHTVYLPGMSVAGLCARDLLQRLICLKYICSIIIPNACILRCTYVLGIMIQLTYKFKANYLQ